MSLAVLAFEGLVALLLIASAVMCWRLDKRLSALSAGRDAMGEAVAHLAQTTARAEASVAALRDAGGDAGRSLDLQIQQARQLADELRDLSTTAPARRTRTAAPTDNLDAFLAEDDDIWASDRDLDARSNFLNERERVRA